MDTVERYWLQTSGLPWQECTKQQYIDAEISAGFRSKVPGEIATGGFGASSLSGRVTRGEINELNYGFDPEFVKIARASKINP